MNTSKISVRYAKALFLAAKDAGTLDTTFRDASLIMEVLADVPDFRTLLGNPVMTDHEKRVLLDKSFGKYLDKLTVKFLDLLTTNNRLLFLPDMVRDFIDLYKKELGISYAQLITAVKIDPKISEKIKESLATHLKKKVQLTTELDPSIIGGFILRIEDLQFDASIASALNRYKKELVKRK
jgi:F-type H+-transporting ATPase subunit delta